MSSLIACYAAEEIEPDPERKPPCSFDSIAAQSEELRRLFPDLSWKTPGPPSGALPRHAEGWLLLPKWEAVASTYNGAVQVVEALLHQEKRPLGLHNGRAGGLGPEYLRRHRHTSRLLQQVERVQTEGDVVVLPAQLGSRHHGRSVRRSRVVFSANEFGLGVFEVGVALLTHPTFLAVNGCMKIGCVGDEYSLTPHGEHQRIMFFEFCGQLVLGETSNSRPSPRIGQATAFAPS